jgi:hypothetical protein
MGSLGLGAGRSQVQILSPRLAKRASFAGLFCSLRRPTSRRRVHLGPISLGTTSGVSPDPGSIPRVAPSGPSQHTPDQGFVTMSRGLRRGRGVRAKIPPHRLERALAALASCRCRPSCTCAARQSLTTRRSSTLRRASCSSARPHLCARPFRKPIGMGDKPRGPRVRLCSSDACETDRRLRRRG